MCLQVKSAGLHASGRRKPAKAETAAVAEITAPTMAATWRSARNLTPRAARTPPAAPGGQGNGAEAEQGQRRRLGDAGGAGGLQDADIVNALVKEELVAGFPEADLECAAA